MDETLFDDDRGIEDEWRDGESSRAVLLAGWLFADLMVALVFVFLGSAPGSDPEIASVTPTTLGTGTVISTTPTPAPTPTLTTTPTPTLTPTPTPTLTPTPTPTVTATLCVPQYAVEKFIVVVPGAPGGGDPSDQQISDALAPFKGRQAGLVLAFGFAPRALLDSAIHLAARTNSRLQSLESTRDIFVHARMEPYWKEGPADGSVSFDMYFLTSC